MQDSSIIYTYHPFKNNNSLIINVKKIQKWFRYYHISHMFFHKNNNHILILTKYNIIKTLILYLKYPCYNYFKEDSLYLKKNMKTNKEFIILYELLPGTYKMYKYLKKLDNYSLKQLYLYVKRI